ncbi:DNA sulfur modification protein DndD [Rhodopirellula halodulae]|uniref:DNA sulfur modification protein DndD n=1 Tax=Rhodopirellula halodulae TaxID=2894198 RepID=UPI001E2B7290|nr:DNA sulfur modification protein DndD [Rhodopirellula sp. JC737]MCC9654580.1 DNA sulfur modification protein DndD [Rhodopirellula sp. JC737]
MILEELTLFNFCLYGGEQVINLAPVRRHGKLRPVVLFGGINGGGKTTILDAVQLALYGQRARCSKRNSQPYEQFLRDCIHRNVDPADGASVGLSFRYASDGKEHLYEVSRRWHGAGATVREKLEVYRDGERDKWLSDNWNTVVEEIIPIGVSRLFFFDAEQIRFLAEDSSSNEALGTAVKALLGLDLAERLIADSKILESRLVKESSLSDADSTKIDELEQLIGERDEATKQLKAQLATAENERQRAQEEVRRAKKAFAKVGGEHWDKREDQQKAANDLKVRDAELKTQLVQSATGSLPISLVRHLLEKAQRQDASESQSARSRVVHEMLEDRDRQIMESLSAELSEAHLQTVDEILAADRQGRLFEGDTSPRHRLSDRARARLSNLLETVLREEKESAAGLVEELNQVIHDMEAVSRSIAATPEEDAIKGVAETLTEKAKEAGALEDQVRKLQKELDRAKSEMESAQKSLDSMRSRLLKDEVFKVEESARMAELASKTQEIMKQFLARASAAKIDRLSSYVTESFRFLLRKKTLVESVQIDPESFSISLLAADGTSISKERLSEGEKQIFAVSVLWGLARASARPLPSIVDTPMARLDATHRNHLVERYFPNASHQVIILSTDTEVDQEYYETLSPHLSHAYHLDYNEKKQFTEATEGYFWEAEAVGVGSN